MADAAEAEAALKKGLADMRAGMEALTAPDGPFPLAEEEVAHYGTVQKYRCWQRGPNSLVRLTLPELYADCFCRNIDKEFLVYQDERLTYGRTMELANFLARELRAAYGVERGACIAIAGRNHPSWVVSFLAATGVLNAVALPVNSWWIGDELRYGLEDSESVLLIADAFVLERAPFLEEIGVPCICMDAGKATELPAKARSFDDVLSAGRNLPPLQLQPVDQDDRAMLMYTSGTTNKPKGVVLTHRGVTSSINIIKLFSYSQELSAQSPGPRPQMVYMAGSPLFHVNGSHVALLASLVQGARLVLMYKWDASRALELVQAEKVVTLVGVPTMTYELVNHPDFDKYDTSSLVGVGGGGAAFAAPMIKRVSDRFKNAKAGTGYGLTETNAISVVMPAPFFPFRSTSCGIPVSNVDVCILDDFGKKLDVGQTGEICMRGATIMKEYWRKPDKTAEVFHLDDEGKLWFRTGDIGAVDEDGFVYIMDRAKDIIIRGGENISCAEVEGAIFEHPAVAEVAAFGVPHEMMGEVVAVAVVFKAGAEAPSDEQLRRHAAGRLANFKVPAEIFRWEDSGLPRGATGKIQKREIREKVAAARAAAAPPPQSKL